MYCMSLYYMKVIFFILFTTLLISVSAQKTYTAAKLVDEIVLDGILDEQSWQGDYVGEFIQYEPSVGAPPSELTKVMIRYDDNALYIGAQLLDTQPHLILQELALRDNGSNADAFSIVLDTYKDGINAFAFSVTAAGVQKDFKYSSDSEDYSWDGVWESNVFKDDKGWYVEMRIPYFTLRFAQREEQLWGLQVNREIRRHRESSFWNPVDPNKDGFVNQFGILKGITNIKPPFRLSATPYVSTYYNSSFKPKDKGSFQNGIAYSAGLDLKLGLNDAFTLDMTLVPDFGQTISDNQVLNLSPFEVFFEENRPFFTESFELFNKGQLFYTRRVGGIPINKRFVNSQLRNNEIILENPSTTSLINATKVSGRTGKKTGIGVFNGITAQENAIYRDTITGLDRAYTTSPVSNYNVAVIDQALKNNSYITLMNTNVYRHGETYDANSTGLYTAFNDKNQKFGIRASGAMSNQYTSSNNIFGYTYNAEIGKYSGKWTYQLEHGVESDTYNPNDLGILFAPNEKSTTASLAYNNYSPKNTKLNRYRFSGGTNYASLFKPNVFTEIGMYFENFWLYKSRDAFGYTVRWTPKGTNDYFEPRVTSFSTYLHAPASAQVSGFFSSDYRKVFAFDARFGVRTFEQQGRNSIDFSFSPRVRFNDRFSMFFKTGVEYLTNNQGFVNRFQNGSDLLSISPNAVLIGQRDRQIITNVVNVKYIFNKNMGLDLRIRHYWDKVKYNSFYSLVDSGVLTSLGFDGLDENRNPYFDVNTNFFNIDMQYQWRFAPGSDLFIVWKNNITRRDNAYADNYLKNFGNLFDQLQNNSISVRAVYFLDYNRFVKNS